MSTRTLKITILLALLTIPATAFYWRAPLVIHGLLLGLSIALISFILLTKIVVKWTPTQYPPDSEVEKPASGVKAGALLLFKMMLTFGVVGVAFLNWKIPPIAFLIGYLNLPVAIFVVGLLEYKN